jgi:hypothetical protein
MLTTAQLQCISDNLPAIGCGLLDIECQCTSKNSTKILQPCLEERCTYDETFGMFVFAFALLLYWLVLALTTWTGSYTPRAGLAVRQTTRQSLEYNPRDGVRERHHTSDCHHNALRVSTHRWQRDVVGRLAASGISREYMSLVPFHMLTLLQGPGRAHDRCLALKCRGRPRSSCMGPDVSARGRNWEMEYVYACLYGT